MLSDSLLIVKPAARRYLFCRFMKKGYPAAYLQTPVTIMYHTFRSFLVLSLTIFCLTLFSGNGSCQEKQGTLTVLPFATPAGTHYDYLQDGLATMLASRLAERADLVVINFGPVLEKLRATQKDPSQLRKIITSIKSDYIVTGSLVAVDENLRLSAHVFNNDNTAEMFSVNTADEKSLFGAVDVLAWDIAEQVFDRKRPAALETQSVQLQQGEATFSTPHPDRTYREAVLTGTGVKSVDKVVESARRSRAIPIELTTMDVGDLDGDTTEEIVLAAKDRLLIYHFSGEHFAKKAEIPIAAYATIHAVNIADVNQDGINEVYVSANKDDIPFSWILTWNGRKADFLATELPYYLRPVALSTKEVVLMGQKVGLDSPLAEAIYQLELSNNGALQQVKKLQLPAGANLFNFVYGDLNGDGNQETIVIDAKNQLAVFDASGGFLFRTGSGYGISKVYLGALPGRDGYDKKRTSVPQRIGLADLNGDGTPEILAAKNNETSIKYLSSFNNFEEGSIAVLTWQENSLVPLWATRNVPGYIAGFQTFSKKNKNNNQKTVLYFGESTSGGFFNFFSPETCVIHAYTLDLTRK